MLITLARRDRENRGFTLVELAGVILVIAILAAIAIPVFQIFQQRSRGSSMDATADNFNTSLVALSQQAGRAANDARDLRDAYAELPADAQGAIAIDVSTDTAADSVAGTWDTTPNANDDYAVIRIVQGFGDNVRAGCLFLPSQEAAGESPVYVRHGSPYEGNDVDWDGDGTLELANGDIADILLTSCRGTGPVDEEEGTAIEDASGVPVEADFDADGTADLAFDDD